MKILVLNSGSSSIKFQLFDMTDTSVIAAGLVERIGESSSEWTYKKYTGGVEVEKLRQQQSIADHQSGLELIASRLLDPKNGAIKHADEIEVVGHRVVHGGEKFSQPTIVTEQVREELEKVAFLAPLHNPANLKGIEIASRVFQKASQVAVFDTAFHQTLPDYAYRFAIPKDYYDRHRLRAYGFHGTSHAYVTKGAAQLLNIPLGQFNAITIHLGNGCSMAAIKNGQSVDVSMGLSPVGGLMMGTRSGDVDPGLLLFLAGEMNMPAREIDQLLNKKSGLKGLAGDNDLRNVLQQYEEGDPDAVLAINMYVYRIRKYLGAYAAVLGRVDAMVFTAGVGENSTIIRSLVCQNLGILGIELDSKQNAQQIKSPVDIGSAESQIRVLVVPTNEELEIAIQSQKAISDQ